PDKITAHRTGQGPLPPPEVGHLAGVGTARVDAGQRPLLIAPVSGSESRRPGEADRAARTGGSPALPADAQPDNHLIGGLVVGDAADSVAVADEVGIRCRPGAVAPTLARDADV